MAADTEIDQSFDFKPINDGLGFHRKAKPLENDNEPVEEFSFSNLTGSGLPGTKASGFKGLLSESVKVDAKLAAEAFDKDFSAATRKEAIGKDGVDLTASTRKESVREPLMKEPGGRVKHNSKSVSELIASLPPALDFLDESQRAGTSAASSVPKYQPSTPVVVKPGAPAAASLAGQGFLKLPLGRGDYQAKGATPALDENLAKTFPTAFPNLGGLAGKAASALGTTGKTAAETAAANAVATVEETPVAVHFGSAVLDSLVAVGFGCVLLAVSLAITNANLLALLENSQTDSATIASLVFLFVSGGLLYVLGARSFMGATLGEWSYEIRAGRAEARTRWFYPLQVLWRGLLVAATGFVLFPIISAIAGQDVLKYLTGLELVSVESSAPNAARN